MKDRLDDLYAVLALLLAKVCDVEAKSDEFEYGKFGWVGQPEGNRVERWELPPGPVGT